MADVFEGDLTGAVFWGADLTGARLRDVNLTDVKVSHAWLVDVEIDALVERVVINGVDVTDFVNQGDEWYPVRSMLRPTEPAAMRATWAELCRLWVAAVERATTAGAVDVRVDDEWSFIETLRHLVFAMDKWFTAPALGGGFATIGMPNTGSVDFPWPDLDQGATPTFAEVLAVRRQRVAEFGGFLANLDQADLERRVDVLENGEHELRDCILTVFEEEFWHLRYATRDLSRLDRSGT